MLAGVSKRTLYQRFPGGKQECKQECFLATYDIIVHRAEMHIFARQGDLDARVAAAPAGTAACPS